MTKIHFIISQSARSQERALTYSSFPSVNAEEADIFVVLGGDGFMLYALRTYKKYNKPFYGINCGHVGFLMNETPDDLALSLEQSVQNYLFPLKFTATLSNGSTFTDFAVNEITLMRHGPITSIIKVDVNNQERIICQGDGLILSTPAGSTAYNSSAGGPILPLNARLLALTPISIYHPKKWKGAILNNNDQFSFLVQHHNERPVHLTYDNNMVEDVIKIDAFQDLSHPFTLLFDKNTSLEERIIKEQFA